MAFLRPDLLEQREINLHPLNYCLSVKFHKNRSINNRDMRPIGLRGDTMYILVELLTELSKEVERL
jgi:hypothetical protein